MKHILIIDDDVHIGNMLEEVLNQQNYQISRAYSGTEALLVLSSSKPDLILLDLMLPGLSGEEVLPQIKGIPVIIVSAKVGVEDKVDLLLGGAVDYITKPFEIKELIARITVQLRRLSTYNDSVSIVFDDIQLDPLLHDVTVSGNAVKLTRTEFAILKILMQNPTQVISKTVLLDNISIDTPDCTDTSLKIHVSNLRKKLREVNGKEYIEAVWGIGFKLSTP